MPDYLAMDAMPAFHPQYLVVKPISPAAGLSPLGAAFLTNTPLLDAVRSNSGLARLARHERNGEIAGVFPIGNTSQGRSEPARGAEALSTLANQSATAPDYAATLVKIGPTVDLDGLVADLNDDPQVAYASPVPARYAAAATPAIESTPMGLTFAEASSPMDQNQHLTWNLERIGLRTLSRQTADDASGIRVGILDTGVDQDHPALQGLVSHYVHGTPDSGTISALDVVGHGTHVSGVINSRYQPQLGTRGITGADLRVWKIFDDQPDYASRAGLYWYMVDPVLYRSALADAADKTDVINLSIGGQTPPDPQEAILFRLLIQRNVCVVAAMGNERSAGSPISYPAAIPGVIAVGATTSSDVIASFSNAGNHISVCAPGASILSTMPTYPGQIGYRATRTNGQLQPGTPFPRDTNFASEDGTSMATPHVTAAAALILANSRRTRTPQEVNDILRATSTQLPSMSSRWNRDYGYGLIQLPRAVTGARLL